MKVFVLAGELRELRVIVNVLLCTAAKQQPELPALMPRWFRPQPMQHRTKRCDACSCSDKDPVTHGKAQNEIAKRSLTGDFISLLHVAKEVRHKSLLNTIETKCETAVFPRRRRDRISTRDLLTVGFRVLERKPLSGHEAETRSVLHLKFEVFGERSQHL